MNAPACLLLTGALLLAGCSNPSEPDSSVAQTVATVDDSELRCLALSMYWEAKAEGDRGMLAVGHVVLNRMAHEAFPDTPCAVVFQGGEKPPCQFSWYCDGKSDQPREAGNWQRARELAAQLLTNPQRDITLGAVFFHSTAMKNPWRIKRTKTVTIGKHVFYKI